MSTSVTDMRAPVATAVAIEDDTLRVDLDDGRTITIPLAWYPRLAHANVEERAICRLIGKGSGIHWPDIEEDVSVLALLQGKASAESPASFKRWLEARSSGSPSA